MAFEKKYADAYDELYQEKDYERECDYIEALFKKYNLCPETILDMGCGTGGHALILARRGYKVCGVDRSAAMLEIAERKAASERVDLEFMEGDMTGMSVNRKFDAVISMFAAISYQTTNAALSAACKAAKESLVPGGIFMFDCWHGPAVIADKPAPRIREVRVGKDEKISRFSSSVVDINKQVVKVDFRLWRMKGSEFRETFESHSLRFLFSQEIRYFLEVAGFAIIDLFPFLDMSRPLTENDWNMMVVGR